MFQRLFNGEKLEALFTAALFLILFQEQVSGDCVVGLCEWSNWDSWSPECPDCGYLNQTRSRSLCCLVDWIEQDTCETNCRKDISEYSDYRTCNLQCRNGGTSYTTFCQFAAGFTGTCCGIGMFIFMFTIIRDLETKKFHV